MIGDSAEEPSWALDSEVELWSFGALEPQIDR